MFGGRYARAAVTWVAEEAALELHDLAIVIEALVLSGYFGGVLAGGAVGAAYVVLRSFAFDAFRWSQGPGAGVAGAPLRLGNVEILSATRWALLKWTPFRYAFAMTYFGLGAFALFSGMDGGLRQLPLYLCPSPILRQCQDATCQRGAVHHDPGVARRPPGPRCFYRPRHGHERYWGGNGRLRRLGRQHDDQLVALDLRGRRLQRGGIVDALDHVAPRGSWHCSRTHPRHRGLALRLL